MPISTIESNKNTLRKIAELAKRRDQIRWTGRTTEDVIKTEGLTPKGVLDGIVSHIERGEVVHRTLSRKMPHTGKIIFEMLPIIESKQRYIKVQLSRDREGNESLIVISAHNPEKGGHNGKFKRKRP